MPLMDVGGTGLFLNDLVDLEMTCQLGLTFLSD